MLTLFMLISLIPTIILEVLSIFGLVNINSIPDFWCNHNVPKEQQEVFWKKLWHNFSLNIYQTIDQKTIYIIVRANYSNKFLFFSINVINYTAYILIHCQCKYCHHQITTHAFHFYQVSTFSSTNQAGIFTVFNIKLDDIFYNNIIPTLLTNIQCQFHPTCVLYCLHLLKYTGDCVMITFYHFIMDMVFMTTE